LENFKMTYESAGVGGSIDVTLPQHWRDQSVVQLGFAYQASEPLTVRWGVNVGSSVIPEQYVNPLFPAIMKEHYTFGLGYAFSKTSELNFAVAYAPQACATDANGITSCTGGQSGQIMYSAKF
jgi:long-chain fatty acid transport protein